MYHNVEPVSRKFLRLTNKPIFCLKHLKSTMQDANIILSWVLHQNSPVPPFSITLTVNLFAIAWILQDKIQIYCLKLSHGSFSRMVKYIQFQQVFWASLQSMKLKKNYGLLFVPTMMPSTAVLNVTQTHNHLYFINSRTYMPCRNTFNLNPKINLKQ